MTTHNPKREFDLTTIKSRRAHLQHCVTEAGKSERMQDKLNWYMRALTGWPSPLDDIDQLIEQVEKQEIFVIYPDVAGDVGPPVGARTNLDEAKAFIDEQVKNNYSFTNLTAKPYTAYQQEGCEVYEVTYKGDDYLSVTYYIKKLRLR